MRATCISVFILSCYLLPQINKPDLFTFWRGQERLWRSLPKYWTPLVLWSLCSRWHNCMMPDRPDRSHSGWRILPHTRNKISDPNPMLQRPAAFWHHFRILYRLTVKRNVMNCRRFLRQTHRFIPRAVHKMCLLDEVSTQQFCLRVLGCFRVNIIPPTIQISARRRRYTL